MKHLNETQKKLLNKLHNHIHSKITKNAINGEPTMLIDILDATPIVNLVRAVDSKNQAKYKYLLSPKEIRQLNLD